MQTITLCGQSVDAKRVLCNWRCPDGALWLISSAYGPCGAVWADSESDALDELCNAGLAGALLIDESDADDESARIGNAGEPADLTYCRIERAYLTAEQLVAFRLAAEYGLDTLADEPAAEQVFALAQQRGETIEAPAEWACYLVNGDASGIDAEATEQADREFDGFAVVDVGCEFIGHWHGLLADMAVYIVRPV